MAPGRSGAGGARMDMLVRGRHVITDPAVGDPGVLDDGAVLVSGSRIAAVGGWSALRRRHPRARPGVRNVDKLVLDSAAFLETLPPDLQAFAGPLVNVDAGRMEEEYFALFAHLHGRFASDDTRVLLSPSWAQACTESFLLRAKATADRLGKVPIPMHRVPTPIQRAFSFLKYGKSALAWLDRPGLVDENLALGH